MLEVETLSTKKGLLKPVILPRSRKKGASPPMKKPPVMFSLVVDAERVKLTVPVTLAAAMLVMLTRNDRAREGTLSAKLIDMLLLPRFRLCAIAAAGWCTAGTLYGMDIMSQPTRVIFARAIARGVVMLERKPSRSPVGTI